MSNHAGSVRCSCGRIILQCRCIGPHAPDEVQHDACDRCRKQTRQVAQANVREDCGTYVIPAYDVRVDLRYATGAKSGFTAEVTVQDLTSLLEALHTNGYRHPTVLLTFLK